jgi:hypothetical protein
MTAQQNFDSLVQTLEQLTRREKLALIERLARSLQEPATEDQVIADQQRQALQRLQHVLTSLPVHNPDDGFSNRDHDRLLYGGP